MIEISNGNLVVKINELLGAEIIHYGTKDKNYLAYYDWNTPVEVSKSAHYETPLMDFMSEYRGGWQVLFPNTGNSSKISGIELPFHGEVSRTKVEIAESSENKVVIKTGCRLPLVLTRSFTVLPDKDVLVIEQQVFNESKIKIPFIWGEHPAFALPKGSRIKLTGAEILVEPKNAGDYLDLPAEGSGIWPYINNINGTRVDLSVVPDGPVERLCYLKDVKESWAAFEVGTDLLGMSWDKNAFPYLWFWQQIGGLGFPWFGRAMITALEPASSWPSYGLSEAIKNNQATYIEPGEIKSSWTSLSLASSLGNKIESVSSVSQSGEFTFAEDRSF